MIRSKRNDAFCKWFNYYLRYRIEKAFKQIEVFPAPLLPGHSVLLLCNHFSWWDGFFGGYLSHFHMNKKYFVMMKEENYHERPYFSYIGGYPISKRSRNMIQSLQYTAELLNEPDNLVIMFPQGELLSNHVTDIRIEKGLDMIMRNVTGNCQIVYSAALIDFYESLKPSVWFHQLNCGTNHTYDFARISADINAFHKEALINQQHVKH